MQNADVICSAVALQLMRVQVCVLMLQWYSLGMNKQSRVSRLIKTDKADQTIYIYNNIFFFTNVSVVVFRSTHPLEEWICSQVILTPTHDQHATAGRPWVALLKAMPAGSRSTLSPGVRCQGWVLSHSKWSVQRRWNYTVHITMSSHWPIRAQCLTMP